MCGRWSGDGCDKEFECDGIEALSAIKTNTTTIETGVKI